MTKRNFSFLSNTFYKKSDSQPISYILILSTPTDILFYRIESAFKNPKSASALPNLIYKWVWRGGLGSSSVSNSTPPQLRHHQP